MSRSPFSKSAITQPAISPAALSESTRSTSPLRQAFLVLLTALAIAILPGVPSAIAQTPKSGGAGTGGDVARGKYLVESVAVCGQCHTPRDSQGNLDPRRWLQGGPVPYQPPMPNSDWPQMVPRIGGTPPGTDADMVKLLTTGIWNTGNRLRLPMPQFRMDVSDAQAVVAYLKTVKPQP